ncbi:MAG: xylose isomerase [Armatimonadota bacterium]
MKLACQESLVPGDSLQERMERLAEWGYEAIELWGSGLKEHLAEVQHALQQTAFKVSTLCAGYRGCLLDSNPQERALALHDLRDLLFMAGDLGAVGVITVPIFGGPRVPDLRPIATPEQIETDLLCALLSDLAPTAEKAGTFILLEPLNRYETHFLRRLEQAVALCERVGHPHIKIMADLFHTSIEEANMPEAIRQAGKQIAHVHLADSNRLQPGHGHIDFRACFEALKAVGFNGYMALECSIAGDPKEALPQCAQFLRQQMQ